VLEYLENHIALNVPLHEILKVLSMQSLIDKGIKDKYYEEIRKNIIHV